MDKQFAAKSAAVQEYCAELWDAREQAVLDAPEALSRALALAVAADVSGPRGYDPEVDLRVAWAREVIAARRRRPGAARPESSGDLEAWAGHLLDRMPPPSGKARACADA